MFSYKIVIALFIGLISSVYSVTETVTALVYADNYFEFYVNGVLVAQDPIDFTPHQGVQFTFTATIGEPRTYAVKANDYATSSGYEYVNTTHAGLGDGALRIKLSDGTVSSTAWKCTTISYGPTAASIAAGCSANNLTPCQLSITDAPDGWTLSSFDDSKWESASVFTEAEAGWGRSPSYDSKSGQCTTLTDPYTGENKNPSYLVLPADECITPALQNW
eukprot:CAMPEP_0196765042 /NCGR_PEP_ID=MMETSP1095-20130614/7443_1 /TAXON_ID=96789 ORGANISM="Chromulina nebulosa, Strain UTEXLB2642" /NCGR_SAMPLE_ID=MMETSP1095 /ASSEMBLY_ACC=CAM_ASM_000446 /LENGTH=218 /DNA_ID=CAMNT_0042122259 /DNA_START=32 /DNA_END=685 /DNA_ORIENTATION=+